MMWSPDLKKDRAHGGDMDVTFAVRAVLGSSEWRDMDPRVINNGGCEDFQQEVLALLGPTSGALEVCDASFPEIGGMVSRTPPYGLPGHYWILCDGRHYDAETPDGVDRWEDLPIFARCLP